MGDVHGERLNDAVALNLRWPNHAARLLQHRASRFKVLTVILDGADDANRYPRARIIHLPR